MEGLINLMRWYVVLALLSAWILGPVYNKCRETQLVLADGLGSSYRNMVPPNQICLSHALLAQPAAGENGSFIRP
jgi:hypothetical protein